MNRLSLLTLVPLAFFSATTSWSQATASASGRASEEVIVQGQRPSDLRIKLEAARVHVYDVFNQFNSDDAFDVRCKLQDSTGTRMRQNICQPRFRTDISNAAVKAWSYALSSACAGGRSQECIFSDAAQGAMSAAQAEESKEGYMQKQFESEMARVVLEHPELQEAMLDYAAVERAYLEATGRDSK
jgi:hypothetical protein